MGLLRIPGAFVSRQGAQDDIKVPVPKHLWRGICEAVRGDIFDEFVDHLEADLLVGFLASPKAQFDPNFHVITEEFNGMISFHCQVVRIDRGRDLKLFHFVGRHALMRVFAALGFFVEEFPVIDDAADRWRGIGGYLNEVEAFGLGQAQRVVQSHNAELLFGIVYDPHFPSADLSVSTMQRLTWAKRTGGKRAAQ